MFKRGKENGHDTALSVNLKIVSLFSVTHVVGTMRRFQCVPTTLVFSINELFNIVK